jgi:hypothetical protein
MLTRKLTSDRNNTLKYICSRSHVIRTNRDALRLLH